MSENFRLNTRIPTDYRHAHDPVYQSFDVTISSRSTSIRSQNSKRGAHPPMVVLLFKTLNGIVGISGTVASYTTNTKINAKPMMRGART